MAGSQNGDGIAPSARKLVADGTTLRFCYEQGRAAVGIHCRLSGQCWRAPG
jgi:hypothetical protein